MKDLLSQNLRAYRQAHNLTQDDLAAVIKKDRSLIAKYESGKAIPPLPVLNVLADLYNISVDTLCGSGAGSSTVTVRDPESEKSVLKFNDLTKEEQLLILKLRLLGDDRLYKLTVKIDNELSKKNIYDQ